MSDPTMVGRLVAIRPSYGWPITLHTKKVEQRQTGYTANRDNKDSLYVIKISCFHMQYSFVTFMKKNVIVAYKFIYN